MKSPLGGRSVWIDRRIDKVTVAQVRAYLEAHGWREEHLPQRGALLFHGRDDDDGLPIEAVLPATEQFDDYSLRLEQLIGTVAWVEDRPAADIITDMLAGPSLNGPTRPHAHGADAAAS